LARGAKIRLQGKGWSAGVLFIIGIGLLGTLLILFANRFSDRHRSRLLQKFVAAPIGMLGIFLLGIAAIVIAVTLILPFIVAGLTMLF
jgi:hypothetical protein